MIFEWDERKRAANLEKHGIDFVDAMTIWQQAVIDPAGERFEAGEYRPTALGVIGTDGLIVAVVYTVRNSVIRIISARRARRNERTVYQDRFGQGA